MLNMKKFRFLVYFAVTGLIQAILVLWCYFGFDKPSFNPFKAIADDWLGFLLMVSIITIFGETTKWLGKRCLRINIFLSLLYNVIAAMSGYLIFIFFESIMLFRSPVVVHLNLWDGFEVAFGVGLFGPFWVAMSVGILSGFLSRRILIPATNTLEMPHKK